MKQLPQLIGAALLLVGYGLSQTGKISQESLAYNLFNLFGAILLLIDAIRAKQWGFIILEAAWVILTIPALWRA
ncbi:MAG: hypothetical protein IPJ76_16650 [Flavobacteriales bacterium]|nr:MAG: hypothetical protein IPJ76_16650 [Flavobacteriales bacterium]